MFLLESSCPDECRKDACEEGGAREKVRDWPLPHLLIRPFKRRYDKHESIALRALKLQTVSWGEGQAIIRGNGYVMVPGSSENYANSKIVAVSRYLQSYNATSLFTEAINTD